MTIKEIINKLEEYNLNDYKLNAVKLVYDISNLNLKQSKELVDIYFKSDNFGKNVIKYLRKNQNDWKESKTKIKKLKTL